MFFVKTNKTKNVFQPIFKHLVDFNTVLGRIEDSSFKLQKKFPHFE
jgi:hypothetical protein